MRATRPPWKRHGRRVRSSSVIFRNVSLGVMGAGNTAWRGFSQEGFDLWPFGFSLTNFAKGAILKRDAHWE